MEKVYQIFVPGDGRDKGGFYRLTISVDHNMHCYMGSQKIKGKTGTCTLFSIAY